MRPHSFPLRNNALGGIITAAILALKEQGILRHAQGCVMPAWMKPALKQFLAALATMNARVEYPQTFTSLVIRVVYFGLCSCFHFR